MEGTEAVALIADDGSFTSDFTAGIPAMLGKESMTHEDGSAIKMFEQTPNIGSLVKSYYDSNRAASRKMENVIERPAADASDEVKAEFHKSLISELGVPESAEGYDLSRPEDLPEGIGWDEGLATGMQAIFKEQGVPKSIAENIFKAYTAANLPKAIEARDVERGKQEALKASLPGDKLAEFTRVALKAINEYGDDGLKKLLKDAKVFDNAADLNLLARSGFDVENLQLWNRIGQAQLPAKVLSGGSPGQGGISDKEAALRKRYPNSPSMWKK